MAEDTIPFWMPPGISKDEPHLFLCAYDPRKLSAYCLVIDAVAVSQKPPASAP